MAQNNNLKESTKFIPYSENIEKVASGLLNEFMIFDDISIFGVDSKQKEREIADRFVKEALKIPAFIDFLNKIKVNERLVADISKNTQELIAKGILQFKTTANGNVSAIIRNGKNQFAEQITLKKEYFSPDLVGSLNNMALQAQLAAIMEQLQSIQKTVDQVNKGQRDDRVALCESAIHQMISANEIRNPNFKQICIGNALKSISDGKTQIFYSVQNDLNFIKNAEVGFFGEDQKNVDKTMLEINKNLSIYIKSSCIESLLYMSVGENQSALIPLKRCVSILNKNFDEDLRLKLNENVGNKLIKNNQIDGDFWTEKFPNVVKILDSKVLEVEKKLNINYEN